MGALWSSCIGVPVNRSVPFRADSQLWRNGSMLCSVSAPLRGEGRVMADRMVGRQHELDALRAWVGAARDGAGRLVVCAGEPGIGKTRLAQELAGVALAGGTAVAWGRCVEAEGAPAFWPWRQVLRSLDVDPDAVLTGRVESPEDRFRAFDNVTEAVRGVAGQSGLVVILDDIHLGDEPSLLVLAPPRRADRRRKTADLRRVS